MSSIFEHIICFRRSDVVDAFSFESFQDRHAEQCWRYETQVSIVSISCPCALIPRLRINRNRRDSARDRHLSTVEGFDSPWVVQNAGRNVISTRLSLKNCRFSTTLELVPTVDSTFWTASGFLGTSYAKRPDLKRFGLFSVTPS